MAMTKEAALAALEALGTDAMRAYNRKRGAGANQFGCKLGDIRGVAKKIKTDHALALELWATKNVDARLLATLVIGTKELTAAALEKMVASIGYVQEADWLSSYVLKQHPDKEALRAKWMAGAAKNRWIARAAWSLTAERVAKDPKGLDLGALLDRIESDMAGAHPDVQWTMNMCLAEIGIGSAKHRKRALAIGEELGVFRDYPTSKGCTSPFAPLWIAEMVKRKG